MNRSIWSVLVITMTILLVVTATANAAPGNGQGNAWGRVARDMREEKSPGSIAVLVHQLKAGTVELEPPVTEDEEEEDEVDEPSVNVPVMVTVFELASTPGDEPEDTTYTVTVLVPGEDGAEPVKVEVTIDEDLYNLLYNLEEGTEIELDVDEDGNYVIHLPADEAELEEVDDDIEE